MTNPLACHECGSDYVTTHNFLIADEHWIACNGCGASSGKHKTSEAAVRAWNLASLARDVAETGRLFDQLYGAWQAVTADEPDLDDFTKSYKAMSVAKRDHGNAKQAYAAFDAPEGAANE